ncbi:hypothetical protein DCC81_08190 [Chitinophaga parva]|uniref:DinB-like domain-containing protein n=1 Tax=Chitinophaga parva TaxID=2169414 RepID=A0A2T7BP20_9BACT|nr:DinB family protein [Chitinophaga parva]PUZ29416.1 hypothetical protein DCC81_08190 [Chitinophaga parva]
MRTILNAEDRNALLVRLSTLVGSEVPLWGKMNVSQMVEHCIRWEEVMKGERKTKRVWLGHLFGKMALKSMIADDKPVKQSVPTLKELIVEDAGEDFETQKEKWITLVKGYAHPVPTKYVHPFFGKMTLEEVGRMAYKHTDHHLRQFGR